MRAVAAHLRAARGVPADPDDVFITAGTGEGLALMVHAAGGSGLGVAVEDPGYPAARRVLTRLGCSLTSVLVDDNGLVIERLAELSDPPRTVLVTPSHQYPLGGCLPVARRLALLDWARRTDVLIVEDDYDSEFRFGALPLPALASLDGDGRVAHLGTFSKVLSPWLRIGYLLAPHRLRPALLVARADLGAPVSGLDQHAVASYLASGALRRHIARTRRDYAHRRRHLAQQLAAHPQLQLRGSPAGLHAVIELPTGSDSTATLQACARQGFLLADVQCATSRIVIRPHNGFASHPCSFRRCSDAGSRRRTCMRSSTMLTLTGGLTIVLDLDRETTYAEVESALNGEGFVSSTSYLIDLKVTPGRTQVVISVHTPIEAITAEGVPELPAVQVMRALADALAAIDDGPRDKS